MARIIDLSLDIYHECPVFDADPHTGFISQQSLGTLGYNITQVIMSTHVGTHLDAPRHFFDDGRTVDQLDLNRCVGKALVIDLSHKQPKETISPDDLAPWAARIGPGTRLLIRSDWWKVYPERRYFQDQPNITYELAEFLLQRGVITFGLETPTVHTEDWMKIHQTLLRAELLIIEGMAHMEDLTEEEVFLIALPLKFRGRDGSPVRAVALEGFG